MSSSGLADVEKKINEVRDRLVNLSLSFQRDEHTAHPSPAAVHASRSAEQRPAVLAERSVNEGCATKGGLSRIVELAKREAMQRQSGGETLQLGIRKESQTASPVPSEKSLTGLQAHTYYDTTPAAAPAPRAGAATSAALFQRVAKPTRAAAFYDSSPTHINLSHDCERFPNTDAPPTSTSTPVLGPETVRGFDPFQAVQARLREKLRKPTLYRSPPSSPDNSAKSPSPKLQEVWQTGPAILQAGRERDASTDTSPNAKGTTMNESIQQRAVEARSPSVRAVGDAIRHVKEQFASVCTPVRASTPRSSAATEAQCPVRRTAQSSRADPRPRRPSETRRESVSRCSAQQRTAPTPRRPSTATARRSTSSRAASPALPVRTDPHRTVLDVLTGAEFFALMRLRGVLVSRGETGECTLPDTRCHSVYLSPEEHRQLVELRANLQLRTASMKTSAATRPAGKTLNSRRSSPPTRGASRR
ncbi:hypothetical protein DQ04_00091220 [Trypanosoma grayi]|uniref:hypothetical protein n=1 Tax=Trypanosoma grayi TaxID=71804 RepID=UPI0004F3F5CE|nr:hypothetical protein DQ04_00091220 [Trypanosoma grayi]KEG15388.1 hypothetical protein DQ04_00091220 [Trypanosoma grayi]